RADPTFADQAPPEPSRGVASAQERYRTGAARRHPGAARGGGDQPSALLRARVGSAGFRARGPHRQGRRHDPLDEDTVRDPLDVVDRRRLDVDTQDLETDMIGAPRAMLTHPLVDRSHVSGGNDRIHELVATALTQMAISPAETAQIVRVVLEVQIALHVPPPRLAGRDSVTREHDRLLHRKERRRPEPFAGEPRGRREDQPSVSEDLLAAEAFR